MENKLYPTKEKMIALIIAMAFLFNAVCLAANLIMPSFVGFGDIFIILLLLVGLFLCFPVMKINRNIFFLCGTILVIMLVSYFYYKQAPEIFSLLQNYIVWGIGISVILMQPYQLKTTLNAACITSCFIIVLDLVLNYDIHYESMTWTYSVFPCLSTMIVHFVYFRFETFKKKMLYIPGLILLFKFVLNANRGGLFSLAFLVYFILLAKVDKENQYTQKRTVLAVVLLLVIFIFAVNFDVIISMAYDLTRKIGLDIDAVNKMYRLLLSDNALNNRDALYEYAWNGFLHSPVWGNGIGSFSVNHGGWTHNLFLQILYEGGIILFLLIFMPLAKILMFALGDNHIHKEEYALFVLLFSSSIPRLLFSTELWNTQSFWMLLVFGLLLINKYKEKKLWNPQSFGTLVAFWLLLITKY